MKRKYFIHKFFSYFFIFTLPILLLGIMLSLYCAYKIRTDINIQAQSTFQLGSKLMEEIVLTGGDIASMFSNNPTVSMSLHKILNHNSLNYKEYVVQNVVFSILENAKSNSGFIESIYIYLDNDQDAFFRTDKKCVLLKDSPDQGWLTISQNSDPLLEKWLVKRPFKNYFFEKERDCISIFRRIDNYDGILVINLNASLLSQLLTSIENYPNESIIVTDMTGHMLFSNSNAASLEFDPRQEIFSQLSGKTAIRGNYFSKVHYSGKEYILTEFASNEYGLQFLSLVPERDIYQMLYQIIFYVIISIALSAVLCLAFSFYMANHNFNQIEKLIEILLTAEEGTYDADMPQYHSNKNLDEYNLILNQVIHTFVRNNTLTMQLKESELRKTTLELKSLQLQINPHFFFNTLQSINMEILKKEGSNSPSGQLIQNLSGILRYALEDSASAVSLRDEIQSCKEYFSIQHFQFPEQIALIWEYEDTVLDCQVLRLLFQPLVENSIRYSILAPSDKCLICIKIQDRKSYLRFHILDTGKGMSREKLDSLRLSLNSPDTGRQSIGIKNIHKRLLLSYPENQGLKLISREGMGTCVSFSIPKNL